MGTQRVARTAIRPNLSIVETIGERGWDGRIEGGASHLNWAALVSGTGISLGIWITLATLGFAIGLVAISPHNPHLKGVLVWWGVWAGIVPILATGIGSLIASWSANSMWAGTGVLYGFAVWGLSLAIGVLFSAGIMVGAMPAVGKAWTSSRDAALGGLSSAGAAFWWMFASFALSLLGSIGGGILGTRIHRPRPRRPARERERVVVTPRPLGAPSHQPS